MASGTVSGEVRPERLTVDARQLDCRTHYRTNYFYILCHVDPRFLWLHARVGLERYTTCIVKGRNQQEVPPRR